MLFKSPEFHEKAPKKHKGPFSKLQKQYKKAHGPTGPGPNVNKNAHRPEPMAPALGPWLYHFGRNDKVILFKTLLNNMTLSWVMLFNYVSGVIDNGVGSPGSALSGLTPFPEDPVDPLENSWTVILIQVTDKISQHRDFMGRKYTDFFFVRFWSVLVKTGQK